MSLQPFKHPVGDPGTQPTVEIPDEILLSIFRSTLPPSWMVYWPEESSPFPLKWSADMRTKLAIIRVCRAWHRVGIEFLYESVVIRQIGQLPALVNALETREGLGALVRHFNICCFPPPGYYDMHDTQITKVFALCGNLAHFAYTPHFTGGVAGVYYTHVESPPPFDRLHFVVPPTVSTLELGPVMNYPNILLSVAHLSSALFSLSLTLNGSNLLEHTKLVFPCLENLRIDCAGRPILHWVVPALRCLVWRDEYTASEKLREFFRGCGQKLKSIEILYPAQQSLHAILDCCPIIEYIAVGYEEYVDFLGSSHPTLASLDVFVDDTVPWYPDTINDPISLSQGSNLNQRSFPSLRICRFLHGSILLHHLRYTPPPALPPGPSADGSIVLEVTSLNSRATSDFPLLSWLPVFLSHEFGSDEDSDEDPDYVPPSEDDGGSVSDSESGSDSDAITVSDSEEGSSAIDGDISAEEALEMYRRTLR
ncbi:hypothetical protein B0H15DRAFT_407869 [Mycena belliarum]|uniref:F-box domain-containing protein n=1 Tax=Mycena belliarum TaxID=1033014 RepID=A0AAD6UFY2_9AGAR|nr:hypothetical protein B0H15DRAFT_407869 [Mycena belliae]